MWLRDRFMVSLELCHPPLQAPHFVPFRLCIHLKSLLLSTKGPGVIRDTHICFSWDRHLAAPFPSFFLPICPFVLLGLPLAHPSSPRARHGNPKQGD